MLRGRKESGEKRQGGSFQKYLLLIGKKRD
jgi:hypothetical protein